MSELLPYVGCKLSVVPILNSNVVFLPFSAKTNDLTVGNFSDHLILIIFLTNISIDCMDYFADTMFSSLWSTNIRVGLYLSRLPQIV